MADQLQPKNSAGCDEATLPVEFITVCVLTLVAAGYFAIWLAVGAGIYALGIAFAATAMRSELFSRVVPLLSGASLIAAGAIQFTRWKMAHLLRCRSPYGCAISCPQHEIFDPVATQRLTACIG